MKINRTLFVYEQWDEFCQKLKDNGFISLSASTILKIKPAGPFVILKHDVENSPSKALKIAQIENKYSHIGSYYVQACLLSDNKNIDILKKIQKLGHEVSYHHDVMDNNNGNIDKAKEEFQKNIDLFERNGFPVRTVCQHGNPVVNRVGYSSNRDFFRDNEISQLYKNITDIMVDYKIKINKNYKYISDAGYGWKVILDPENNDLNKSYILMDISLNNLDDVFNVIKDQNSAIISTHPHRWHNSIATAQVRNLIYIVIKNIAKYMLEIPTIKKLVGKFFYLAKRI